MWKLRVALAIVALTFILALPSAEDYRSYLDILKHTAMTLKGQAPFGDVAQDIYGFRALMTNQDPYARLKPALKSIGVEWNAGFTSTHPPTAFLLVAPVAFLPWPISSMLWAWLMLICLFLSLRFGLDYKWDEALLLTSLALYWPPISTSFDQITIVWLFGLAMAYRFRNHAPFWAGIWIGIASFTKLLPIVLLVPFLLRRRWAALVGFATSWLAALGVLVLLSPKALLRYLTSNRTNATDIITRWDNGSFLLFLSRRAGMIGSAVTVILLLFLILLAYRSFRQARAREIGTEEWNIYAVLAILLMPITWIFTIAPLLPNLLLSLQNERWISRALAVAAVLPPIFFPPWGTRSTFGIFGFLVLAGVAFASASSSPRHLQQSSETLRPGT